MYNISRYLLFFIALINSQQVLAVDSYRYLHVTIDTPWAIFLFLLPIVLSPFIIMAILYWRIAIKKSKAAQSEGDQGAEDKH